MRRRVVAWIVACCALLTACEQSTEPGQAGAVVRSAPPAAAAISAPAPTPLTTPGPLAARAPMTATPPARPVAVPAAASASTTAAAPAVPAVGPPPASAKAPAAPAKPPGPAATRVRAGKGETCSQYVRYCVDWCGANMSGVTACLDGCRTRGETCNATGEWTVEEGVKVLTHMPPR